MGSDKAKLETISIKQTPREVNVQFGTWSIDGTWDQSHFRVIRSQLCNDTKSAACPVEHLLLGATRVAVGPGATPFNPAGCGTTVFSLTMANPPAVTLLGYLAATLTTLSFFPQAIKTIRTGDTTAISLRMYLLLSVGIACWGLYGFIIQDGPVMVANAITLVPALVVLQRKISQMLHNRHARRIQQG